MSDARAQSTVPIVEVAFAHGKWWSMPQEYESGRDAIYTWNWGEDGRAGSWTRLIIPSMCDEARCVTALIRVYGIVRAGCTVCVWR